ncbi:MAG: DUF2252 domain-containing protein [Streptosporangiaceae bacterium]
MSKTSPGVLAPPHEVLTPEEWLRRGRDQRKLASRRSHSQWEAAPDRPDPIAILEEQARTRVSDLVPIRYGRMAASPFAYFRGAAAPMAWDLAHTPAAGIRVQACGDAHLLNFGMFAAPDRQMVFDVNDFDETLPAPFEWDVKRLAASFAIAARDKELPDRDAHTAARLATRSYRTEMSNYAAMRFLDVWYARIDIAEVSSLFDALQPKAAARRRHKDIAKARRRTSLTAFLKMCDQVEGQYRIRPAHPVIVRYPIERHPGVLRELRHAIGLYLESLRADQREVLRRYYFGDFARKVVGVGSVGTEAFVVLLLGDRADEPLFLQLKEAQESVLAPFAGKSEFSHEGERVVSGQRLTQAAADPFLGWTSGIATGSRDANPAIAGPKDYYVRQLRDMKGSMSVQLMDAHQLNYYGRLCGWALARAHARTGRAAEITGYLGSSEDFDHAIADFAVAYADQNEQDYGRLLQAISAARIQATVGQ